jgi:hypothetical protein
MKKIALMMILAAILLSPISAQALSVGTWGASLGGQYLSTPTVGMQVTDALTGYIGMRIAADSADQYLCLVKADYNVVKMGNIQHKAGAYYIWVTDSDKYFITGLTWGMSTMLTKSLSIGIDVKLAEQYSGGGETETMYLPGTAIAINFYL